MTFATLFNTIRWTLTNQRRLLAEAFGDRDTFEIEEYLPICDSQHIFRDKGFARRRLIFFRDLKMFAAVLKRDRSVARPHLGMTARS